MTAALAVASGPAAAQSPPGWTGHIDWARFDTAMAAYAAYPSDANAEAVRGLLPREHVSYDGSAAEHAAMKTLDDGLDMLQRQVEARDSAAVRLAFDMWVVADGEYWERLDIMLGKLIRIDPALFLSAAREHEQRTGQPFLTGGIVGNLGVEFVDKIRANCREMRLRVRSLEAVQDRRLQVVKREALSLLKGEVGVIGTDCSAA